MKARRIYSADGLLQMADELRRAKDAFLRKHGWKYTSDTPGCLWLWEKKTGDRTILVATDVALSMQRHSHAIRGNEW
jgi:hypothetical protein